MPSGYTYIMGSHTGVLYIGVTSDLDVRVPQHKDGVFEGFSTDYGCTRLLYFEAYDDIRRAIGREKQLKGWRREKKLALIRRMNTEFRDLRDLREQFGWKFITRHASIHG